MPWGLIDAAPIAATVGLGDSGAASIASQQHGLITTSQLNFVRLNADAIHHRVRRGRLHRIHRGVYAVGHASVGELGTFAAALLAGGPGSVLSHRPAAAITKTLIFSGGPIDISRVRAEGHRRSRTGITVHHVASLDRLDLGKHGLVTVTASDRTLIDIAETDRDELESALNEARALRLITPTSLRASIRRNGGRVGAARLAALLESENDHGFSRSRAERILAGLIRRACLPAPRRNGVVDGIELDFYWPEQRLNAEVDGFTTHGRRRNFESDRDRDAHLATRGIQVMRFTWWQLTREAPKVVARLAGALALRGI